MRTTKRTSVEAEFELRLKVDRQQGVIWDYTFQPRTFIIGMVQKQFGNRAVEKVHYTPDFWVQLFEGDKKGVMIETKGPWIPPDKKLRFKIAAYMYRTFHQWQLWQKTKRGIWKRHY